MKLSSKTLFTVIAATACASRCCAVSFQITKVYTVNAGASTNAPYVPHVGEPYTVGVKYTQTGTASGPYKLSFRLADRVKTIVISNTAPGDKYFVQEFGLVPLDDTIDIEADIDPDGAAVSPRGPTQVATFTPVPPDAPVDFYDPMNVVSTQYFEYHIQTGGKYSFHWLEGCPVTDGWQTVMTSRCTVNGASLAPVKMANPLLYPLFYYGGNNLTSTKLNFVQESTMVVRNQRVNPTKLRQVTWGDMDALKGIDILRFLTRPESVIQSEDPVIKNFVEKYLGGAGYRSKLTPYDACRTVFRAVLAHCSYYYPQPGQPDTRAKDPIEMVLKGQGDCGSFSGLLVACYRQMGIPARSDCGGWIGTGQGHCWCEMWFPRAGWIVSDGSAGKGNLAVPPANPHKQVSLLALAPYAYYFGFIPDLNIRYAQCRGNTFAYADTYSVTLQGCISNPIITNCVATAVPGVGILAFMTKNIPISPAVAQLHAMLAPYSDGAPQHLKVPKN